MLVNVKCQNLFSLFYRAWDITCYHYTISSTLNFGSVTFLRIKLFLVIYLWLSKHWFDQVLVGNRRVSSCKCFHEDWCLEVWGRNSFRCIITVLLLPQFISQFFYITFILSSISLLLSSFTLEGCLYLLLLFWDNLER